MCYVVCQLIIYIYIFFFFTIVHLHYLICYFVLRNGNTSILCMFKRNTHWHSVLACFPLASDLLQCVSAGLSLLYTYSSHEASWPHRLINSSPAAWPVPSAHHTQTLLEKQPGMTPLWTNCGITSYFHIHVQFSVCSLAAVCSVFSLPLE